MDFEVLGPLQIRADGGYVRLPPKPAALLAALLSRPGLVVADARLIDALWPDSPPRSAAKSLQIYIHHLRQELGDDAVIERAGAGYRLAVDRVRVDALRFVDLAEQAERELESGRAREAARMFAEAMGLWRGAAFAGHKSLPVVREEAARLDELRQRVAETRFDTELALGRHSAITAELSALVAEHPFRERLRAQLMLAYHRTGRASEALEAFREGRELLVEELGIEPGRELAALEQAILRNDPGLDESPGARRPGTRWVPYAADSDGDPAGRGPDASGARRQEGEAGPDGPATRPGAAPAAPAPRPVPAQLPPAVADFTGREEQVAQLCTAMGAPAGSEGPRRPVTISAVSGMGGIGKTALALRVAHTRAADFPDGQLYADLRGAQESPADPAQVLAGFLHAVGVEGAALPERLEERSALFRSMLAGRRMLLLLDDVKCERQVRPVLPGAAGCAVLVTSRARLTGLEGADLVDLDVLQPGQSVELLARIAGEERVAAEPGAAAEIAGLCGQCPLAVRIAGARLKGRPQWPLARMVRLLGDERRRLDELAVGDLGVRASFALSYAGLEERTRRMFRMLGALEAEDTAAWTAAAAAGGDLAEGEAAVEDLVDAQLLSVVGTDGTGQPRYRMHDLVRLFARERGEEEDAADEREAAVQRALGAWLWLAEQATEYIPGVCYATMHGPAPRWPLPASEATVLLSEPMAWFDAESAAMVTAVEQACSLGWHEIAWDLAGCLEKYFDVRGRFDDWRRTHEPAIAVCRAAGDVRGEAVLRRGLADLVTWQSGEAGADGEGGAMGTLLGLAQQVWDLFQQLGDRRGMSDALVMRTWAEVSRGTPEQALRTAEAALELAEGEAYTGGRARSYQVMAVAAHGMGRPSLAVEYLQRALELARLLGNSRFEATALQFLGAAQCEAGDLEQGRANLEASLAITRALSDRYAEAFSLLYLTRLHLATGDPRALDTAAEAADLSRRYGINHHLADALGLRGRALLEAGRADEAVEVLEDSVALWRTRGWLAFLAESLRSLAHAYEATGDRDAAARAAREAGEISTGSAGAARSE
ncbi:AfsR/SARP family transcriptional regulator [Streptomonospora wellingtoniae]|uniref:BTAD domain-containing putative transcriptional regulator n=1 Tax=Streptomonospora wellingtoniae TaxID=3075544 RepID=A0ABU2KTD9_9ACTN|nr:BTAD domain-containing putative transcriptional regulator [Streptomonospora sp. DSM 45055]MDT0302452.1 BTAD domain-containing putative transcriptional regulator [Streptomonospora sp. DSM 45055]